MTSSSITWLRNQQYTSFNKNLNIEVINTVRMNKEKPHIQFSNRQHYLQHYKTHCCCQSASQCQPFYLNIWDLLVSQNCTKLLIRFILEQAMKAQTGNRGRDLFFFNLGFTWRLVVKAMPPAALPAGLSRYPLHRRLGGLQGLSGRVRKISPQPGFELWTVQPVVSRYTEWAIQAHKLNVRLINDLVKASWRMYKTCTVDPRVTTYDRLDIRTTWVCYDPKF
jgi:hypothetical protein